MKKIYLLAVIGLIASVNSHAKKVEGKIIFRNNDTMNVVFNLPTEMGELDYVSIQRGIRYYDSLGNFKY